MVKLFIIQLCKRHSVAYRCPRLHCSPPFPAPICDPFTGNLSSTGILDPEQGKRLGITFLARCCSSTKVPAAGVSEGSRVLASL